MIEPSIHDLQQSYSTVAQGVHDLQAWTLELAGRISNLEHGPARVETPRDIYLALAEVTRERDRDIPARESLTKSEVRVFSQNGEDGVIAEIIRRIGPTGRFFVEFGAGAGREGNCVLLADVLSWNGVFIESDASYYSSLAAKYRAAARIETLKSLVTAENVESLFASQSVPQEFDVLSLDVDGQDYWIWEALNAFKPRLVVIEYNAALPVERCLVQPRDHVATWDGTDYYGASLGALERLAANKGYALVHTELSAVNAFFVRQDLLEDRFPDAEQVPRRADPDYFMRGIRHPRDPERRPYLDLDTAEFASPPWRETRAASGTDSAPFGQPGE